MKSVLTTICIVLFAFGTVNALTVLDLEDVPETYWYFGGDQNLGDFYEGLFFGPDATILESVVYGYNNTGYPPHSGNQVLFTDSDNTIRVDFEDPTNHVGVWYTAGTGSMFYLEGYDSDDNLLASISGPDNYGQNDFLEINADGIDYVLMHNSGNFYTIDDFEYEETLCSDVDMVPDDDPVMVPPGGTFGLTGYIANPNPDPIVTDVWVGVIYLGDFFQLWNFGNIPLDPGEELSAHLNQSVPVFAPSGTYTYIAFSGEKPEACDSAMFEFTVTAGSFRNGAENWAIEGGWEAAMVNTAASPSYALSPANESQVSDILDYTPEECMTFTNSLDVTLMSIACNDEYMYSVNGGISSLGAVEKFDLEGNSLGQVSLTLDMRAIFFNPNDGQFYVKIYGTDLYQIDPEAGTYNLVCSGVFHDYQAKVCYDPAANLMYEHSGGTVWVIDFETCELVDTMYGFTTNGWGFEFCIATNGCNLFTWEDGGDVHVYEFDGTYVETFNIPNGWSSSWGWTLSVTCEKLFTGTDGPGGTWYGYCGLECGPCCDVDMTPDDDPVIVEPGGRFGLTGYIGNPTDDPITTDVWGGVIYLGDFFQQFAFNNIPLDPGESMTAHTWQNVPGFAPLGTYTYMAYCGDRPDEVCDSASFPFTVAGARIADGAAEWSIEGEFFGSEIIPTEYGLQTNYPNPFNASTNISFSLPEAGEVSLEVYNLMGQRVATLVNGNKVAGQHTVTWDAASFSSGVYFYKLSAGDNVITKRMTLLK